MTEFRIRMLNHFPQSADIFVKELTWDTSQESEVSDEERERLTVWYVERYGNLMPVEYREWNDGA